MHPDCEEAANQHKVDDTLSLQQYDGMVVPSFAFSTAVSAATAILRLAGTSHQAF